MSYFIIRIRLAALLSSFLYSLACIQLIKMRVFSYFAVFFILILLCGYTTISDLRKNISNERNTPVNLSSEIKHSVHLLTQTEAQLAYEKMQTIEKKYLPQRDLLFNSSLIAKSLNKLGDSAQKDAQAHALDPNSLLFQ